MNIKVVTDEQVPLVSFLGLSGVSGVGGGACVSWTQTQTQPHAEGTQVPVFGREVTQPWCLARTP